MRYGQFIKFYLNYFHKIFETESLLFIIFSFHEYETLYEFPIHHFHLFRELLGSIRKLCRIPPFLQVRMNKYFRNFHKNGQFFSNNF